jgi:hypothetical protein
MIEMFLNFGEISDPERSLPVLAHQGLISKLLLVVVVVTPPWMLIYKPYLLKKKHDEAKGEKKLVEMKEHPSFGGKIEMTTLPQRQLQA